MPRQSRYVSYPVRRSSRRYVYHPLNRFPNRQPVRRVRGGYMPVHSGAMQFVIRNFDPRRHYLVN